MSKIIIFISFMSLIIISCSKEEGKGGGSSIQGKLKIIDYNKEFTNIREEYYAQGEDVYLVYGDDEVYSERFKTHHDGTYLFEYLRKGKYTVYAYSKDSTASDTTSVLKPIEIEVEIKKNREDVFLLDIVVLD